MAAPLFRSRVLSKVHEMNLVPRIAIRLLPCIFAILYADVSQAEDYPAHELHFISPFTAGSGADVLARYFSEKLRPLAGQPVLVENKTGAGSNIAIEYTARSKPDG